MGNNGIADSVKNSAQSGTSSIRTATASIREAGKEQLNALDGYRRSASTIISNTKDGILSKIAEVKNWITNTSIGSLGSLSEIMSKVSDVKKDITDFTSDVREAIGATQAAINSVSQEVMGSIQQFDDELKKSMDADYWINGSLNDITNEYNRLIDQVNSLSATIDNRIDDFRGTFEQMAVDYGLMKDAVYVGSVSSVKLIMGKYPDEVTAKKALGDSFPQAIYNGDLEMMKVIIGYCSAEYLNIIYPNVTSMILRSFRFKLGVQPNQYEKEGEGLLEVLVSLNPRWNYAPEGLHNEQNLTLFVFASDDTKSALRYKSPFNYVIPISQHVHFEKTIKEVSKEMYPGLVF